MTEVTYRRIQIVPYEGKFSVVLEWSDVCALTLTKNTLDEAFEAIRENLSGPRVFALLPTTSEMPWTT
jgi:hypothetical protein